MKRRSFLQFLGLAPAAAVAPKVAEAAEKMLEPYQADPVFAEVVPQYDPVDSGITYSVVCQPFTLDEMKQVINAYTKK
jgi:hypothetical protein